MTKTDHMRDTSVPASDPQSRVCVGWEDFQDLDRSWAIKTFETQMIVLGIPTTSEEFGPYLRP